MRETRTYTASRKLNRSRIRLVNIYYTHKKKK